MARLPDIRLNPQSGQPASMATLQPVDLNLDDVAATVGQFAEKQKKDDEKAVTPLLEELAAGYGREFATAAEQDDGTQGGFAKRQLDMYDLHAGELATRANLSGGKAEALRRGIEAQRLHWGQQAVSAEAKSAGQYAADQERARRNGVVSHGLAGYQAAIAAEDKALDDAYDGTSPTFVQDKLALHDRFAAQALEAAPEADRPALKIALENQRLNRVTQSQAVAEKLTDAVIARQASETRDTLANAVLSNPNGIGAALGALDAAYADVPAAVRAQALREGRSQIASMRLRGLMANGQPALAVAELSGGKWDKLLTPDDKARLLTGGQTEAAQRARDALEAMQYGGEVDQAEADANVAASGDDGLKAQMDYRRAYGWAEQNALGDGFAGGKAGFEQSVNFVIDDLEGGEGNIRNDNGRGLSRFGINQAANPDLDVSKLTRGGATQRYRARYWNAVGADKLPPDLALAAFDAAVLFGPDDANRWKAASGGDVGRFLSLEQAEMQRLAREDPKKYGDDLKGWLNRLGKVRNEAARQAAFVNTRDGMASDPIKFATKSPALRSRIVGLAGEPGEATWGASIQARLSVGRELNRTYRAPLRMLTDAEAAFYKDRIAQDPTYALNLSRAALAAVGPVATRSLLAELGQQGDAGAHLHLADLYAMGSRSFAEKAERGLALKGGALDEADGKALAAAVDRRKAVFAGQPELRATAFAVAKAAMLADAQSGDPKDPDYYLQGALGGRTVAGKVFGGIAEVNGRATIVPAWLAGERADEALEFLGAGFEANARTARPPLPSATGMRQKGNLEAFDRPRLVNPDGSVSTASSISIGTDQGEVLIPTVVNGKRLTNDAAIAHYKATGQHFGIFDTPANADAYAVALHNAQEKALAVRGGWPVWANGQAMSAREIGRLSLSLLPSGRYALVDAQGRAMKSSRGGVFELNLDAARPALRAQLGAGAVLAP